MTGAEWLGHRMRWLAIGGLHVVTGKYFISKTKYGNKVLHSGEEGNARLRELVRGNSPFAFCRFSYTEMDIMIRSITERLLHVHSTDRIKWLDIFCEEGEPASRGAAKYTELMSGAFKDADMIGIWDNMHMGDALLKTMDTKEDVFVTDARSVEGYSFTDPWTRALEGKKVLVVSPFSEAIRYQYGRKELVWGDRRVLPDFSLDTEDAIWYYAGKRDERFSDWFKAYDHLFDTIMSHDFDICILACGYFGFGLAAGIKRAGKQAVHMGGATQLLFGIKGKRWDGKPGITALYNDNWIRPDASLKPTDDKNLDDGCYW